MNRNTSIAFIAAGLIATTSAFAWYGEPQNAEGGKHRMKGGKHHAGMMMQMGKNINKEFTADEVRTLSEARLIMKGTPHVKVGEVKPTDTGYHVTIVANDNSLIEELNLAKNGMPLERYEAVQKRREMHKNGGRKECAGKGERSEHRAKAGQRGHKGKHGQIGKQMMAREFTADQIETLSKAKLIMRGNPNLKLGEVTSTDSGYKVTIVTQDNSLVEERKLARNGMPVEKFEQMQKRLERRQERINAQ